MARNIKRKGSLPHGWVVRTSKKHPDLIYYFNAVTGDSTWECPSLDPPRKKSKSLGDSFLCSNESNKQNVNCSKDFFHSSREGLDNRCTDRTFCTTLNNYSENSYDIDDENLTPPKSLTCSVNSVSLDIASTETVEKINCIRTTKNNMVTSVSNVNSPSKIISLKQPIEFSDSDLDEVDDVEMLDVTQDLQLIEDLPTNTSYYIIVDTNIFIYNLKQIGVIKDHDMDNCGPPHIFIPWVVIQELDGLKRDPKLKFAAIDGVKYINKKIKSKDPRFHGQSPKEVKDWSLEYSRSNDDRILECCMSLADKMSPNKVILLTNDINLANKSLICDISAYDVKSFWKQFNVPSVKKTVFSSTNKASTSPNKSVQPLAKKANLAPVIKTVPNSAKMVVSLSTKMEISTETEKATPTNKGVSLPIKKEVLTPVKNAAITLANNAALTITKNALFTPTKKAVSTATQNLTATTNIVMNSTSLQASITEQSFQPVLKQEYSEPKGEIKIYNIMRKARTSLKKVLSVYIPTELDDAIGLVWRDSRNVSKLSDQLYLFNKYWDSVFSHYFTEQTLCNLKYLETKFDCIGGFSFINDECMTILAIIEDFFSIVQKRKPDMSVPVETIRDNRSISMQLLLDAKMNTISEKKFMESCSDINLKVFEYNWIIMNHLCGVVMDFYGVTHDFLYDKPSVIPSEAEFDRLMCNLYPSVQQLKQTMRKAVEIKENTNPPGPKFYKKFCYMLKNFVPSLQIDVKPLDTTQFNAKDLEDFCKNSKNRERISIGYKQLEHFSSKLQEALSSMVYSRKANLS